jgi:branched-chain amino acid transport system ATP-binding protein
MLEVSSVSVAYETLPVLFEASLRVTEGEIVAVLGTNGAGKTTLLRAISGLVPLRSGTVRFEGKDLKKVSDFERVALGLVHVPEGRRVFASLTVMENLRLGGKLVLRNKQELNSRIERAFGFFPRLRERSKQIAATLSGGEQQMLAVARGLMSNPRLLMIDEASLGLAPSMIDQLFDILREIHADGTSLLIVEQNTRVSLEIAHRAYVLEKGTVVFDGTAAEMMEDPRLLNTYLGGELSAPAV